MRLIKYPSAVLMIKDIYMRMVLVVMHMVTIKSFETQKITFQFTLPSTVGDKKERLNRKI